MGARNVRLVHLGTVAALPAPIEPRRWWAEIRRRLILTLPTHRLGLPPLAFARLRRLCSGCTGICLRITRRRPGGASRASGSVGACVTDGAIAVRPRRARTRRRGRSAFWPQWPTGSRRGRNLTCPGRILTARRRATSPARHRPTSPSRRRATRRPAMLARTRCPSMRPAAGRPGMRLAARLPGVRRLGAHGLRVRRLPRRGEVLQAEQRGGGQPVDRRVRVGEHDPAPVRRRMRDDHRARRKLLQFVLLNQELPGPLRTTSHRLTGPQRPRCGQPPCRAGGYP